MRMVNQWVRKFLIPSVFLILSIFPFALGSAASIANFNHYTEFKISSLLIILCFTFGLLAIGSIKKWSGINEIFLVSLLFLLAISIRLTINLLLDTQPASNFQEALIAASNFQYGSYPDLGSARNPHWGFFSITAGMFLRWFGDSIETLRGVNLFFSGLTSIFIYLLGKKLTGSKKFGGIASLVYVVWPQDILYKSLPTGEHIFSMLLPAACLLFLTSSDLSIKKFYLNSAAAAAVGLLLGIMDAYKPVAFILLLSFALTLVLDPKTAGTHTDSLSEPHPVRPWKKALLLAFIAGAFFMARNISFSMIKQKTTYPPNQFEYGWTLRMGMDMEHEGKWYPELSARMSRLYTDYDEDYAAVNSLLFNEVKEGLSRNLSKIPAFLAEKFKYVWQSDWDFYYWTTLKQSENGQISSDPENLAKFILPFLDIYLVFTLFFSTAGAVYCACKPNGLRVLPLALFIIGFTAVLLFSEVQQRYRSVLVSAIPIFTTYGFFALVNMKKALITHMREIKRKIHPNQVI